MNQRSRDAGNSGATGLILALLCLLGAGHANANTYFRCVDAKGAVTVQQTACATSSVQEERKMWVPSTQATPPAASVPERSSPVQRRADDTPKPKDR
jgi:hypothetical protein